MSRSRLVITVYCVSCSYDRFGLPVPVMGSIKCCVDCLQVTRKPAGSFRAETVYEELKGYNNTTCRDKASLKGDMGTELYTVATNIIYTNISRIEAQIKQNMQSWK